MRLHGGVSRPELKPDAHILELEGDRFSHIFGPDRLQTFKGYGFGAGLSETKRLLEALAYRMCSPYEWAETLPGARMPDENPNLPSGFTYLAQFVAHDMSLANTATPLVEDSLARVLNLRSASLRLDTLYGGGLVGGPLSAYCRAAGSGGRTPMLRLGCLRTQPPGPEPTAAEARLRARDLPRNDRLFPGDAGSGFGDVLCADPRNDDQPIVAQICVLFALLHNAVCERLEQDASLATVSVVKTFEAVRAVVVAIYHRLIKHDLLARLLSRPIHKRYISDGAALLDNSVWEGVPVEFSHAAFRAGHAMVREGYTFNDDINFFGLPAILRQNSVQSPFALPLTASWSIKWSRFFNLGAVPTNLSRRLGPSITQPLFDPVVFDNLALPQRDLTRSAQSVRSLQSFLDVLPKEITSLSRLLGRDSGERQAAVSAWLAQPVQRHPSAEGKPILTARDQAILADDPPLPFFILLESAVTEGGERLGTLGSLIVAETLCRALEPGAADPTPMSDNQLARVLGAPPPDDMPSLIRYLQDHYCFPNNPFPFL